MNYALEIQKHLLKVESHVYPEDKIIELKQAIQKADVNNDIDWGYELRLKLISEETNLPYFIDSFPAFAWILEIVDSYPERFEQEEFIWLYKWAATAAYSYAETPYNEIEKIFSDMKVRIEERGYSLRGYYSTLIYWEVLLGNIENAAKYLELQKKEPKDIISDDDEFELDTQIEIALLQKEYDKAVFLSKEFIEKSIKGFFPFATYSYMTYYLYKAQDVRAEEFYKKTEEALKDVDTNIKCIIDCISCLINYAALYNEARALELFEKYAELEIQAMDSMSFLFSKNVLILFRKKEKVKLNISSRFSYYQESGIYDKQEIYNFYYNKAKILAEKFDNRNKSLRFGRLLQDEIENI